MSRKPNGKRRVASQGTLNTPTDESQCPQFVRDSHLSFSPVESELIPDTPGLMGRRSGTCGLYSSVKAQEGEGLRMATASVRYIVDDVDAPIAFYCRYLDFHEQMRIQPPTFAMLSPRRPPSGIQRTKRTRWRRAVHA